MSDILGIYPKTGYDIKGSSVELPLGLLSTVADVHEDCDVVIIDQRTARSETHFWRDVDRELSRQPSILLVPSMTGTQLKYALDISAHAKSVMPRTKIVWGGVHATLMPEQTVRHPLVDVAVIGEAEFVMRDIMGAVAGARPFESVSGIMFKDGAGIHATAPAAQPDPNLVPEIPYGLVDVENYVKAGGIAFDPKERTLPFISSRGCPYGCTFCSTAGIAKGRWRAMTADLTVERARSMVRRYRLDAVKFYDENFTSNPKRAEDIAAMIAGDFAWSMQARMDNMLVTDMKALEAGGLRIVEPGIESGSDRILKLVNKGETKATMIAANRKLSQTGIKAFYNFMMGFPGETREELMETVDLALQITRENPNAHITQFYIFVPYLGAPLFDRAVAEGFPVPQSVEEWIAFSRQQTYTPWIQDRKEMLETIMYTSKFVDGKRLSQVLRNTPVPKFAIRALSAGYRRRWEQHDFRKPLSIRLLDALVRRQFHWTRPRTVGVAKDADEQQHFE